MEKKTKKSLIIGTTGLLLVTLLLLGLTYAYYRTRVIGNEQTSVSVTSKVLELTYEDGTNELFGVSIEPSTKAKKTFTVENTGTETIRNYMVIMENIYNQFSRPQDLVYTLTCDIYTLSGDNYVDSGYDCNGVLTKTQIPQGRGSASEILVTNDISVGEKHYYTFNFEYINEVSIDQSDDMGQKLEANISVYDKTTLNPYHYLGEESLSYNIVDSAIAVAAEKTSVLNSTLEGPAAYYAEAISNPGNAISGKKFIKSEIASTTTNLSFSELIGKDVKYWSYGDSYTFNENGGYTIKNTKSFDASVANNYKILIGKYLRSNETDEILSPQPEPRSTINMSTIYYVENVDVTNKNITLRKLGTTLENTYESTLSSIDDGNGNSYYFRGAVTNNYVDFAGMCWRIVRIESDGSIKMILEDYDNTCAAKTGNYYIPSGFSIYGRQTDTANYGYEHTLRSDVDPTVILQSHMNYLSPETDSLRKTENYALINLFKNFETGKLASVIDKVKTDTWCLATDAYGDKTGSVAPSVTFDYNTINTEEGFIYYDTYVRLRGKDIREVTLDCNGQTFTSKVATLTADEVALAGTMYKGNNDSFYLNNGSGKPWFTLSPWMFNYDSGNGSYDLDNIAVVTAAGQLNQGAAHGYSDYFARPAITLNNNVTIQPGGDGTITNPYVIK